MIDKIRQVIRRSIDVKSMILDDLRLLNLIQDATLEISRAFRNNKKVLICGNGGSAADAQHIAAEFTGKFYFDRPPLYAEALHVNTSYMTAVANDYSYDDVFSRLVVAKGSQGDILLSLSTSGNSKNVIKAIIEADRIGMISVGMTGAGGGKMKDLCKYLIDVPSNDTPRIQEAHILIGHIICQLVEEMMFGN